MRQRKFRIWNLNKKQWEDPNKFATILSNGETLECESTPISYFWREPLCACKIQQWTGLKDKNGKEIYEGDIVQYNVGSSYENMSFIVQWSGDSLGYILQSQSGDILTNSCTPNGNRFNFIELKGNIFETPELLKQ